MKIVINNCFGGFSISIEAAIYMASLGNEQASAELATGKFSGFGYAPGFPSKYDRTSPELIAAVEKLGKRASGGLSKLIVVEIPDGVDYYIHEYDGLESVHEKHRVWP